MMQTCKYYLGLRELTPREVALGLADQVAKHQERAFDPNFVEAERARWAALLRTHGAAKAYSAYQAAACRVPETPTRSLRNELMAATGLPTDRRYQDHVSAADDQEFADYRAYCDAQAQSLFDGLPADEPSSDELGDVRRKLCALTRLDDPRRRAVELKLVNANIVAGNWADAFGVLQDILAQHPEALLVRARDPLAQEKQAIMGRGLEIVEKSQEQNSAHRRDLLQIIEAALVKALADGRAGPSGGAALAETRAALEAIISRSGMAETSQADSEAYAATRDARALMLRLPAGDAFRRRGLELVAEAQGHDPQDKAAALKKLGWLVKHPRLRYLQLADQAAARSNKTEQVLADIEAVRTWGKGASVAGMRLAQWVEQATTPNPPPGPDFTTAQGRSAARAKFKADLDAAVVGFPSLKGELVKVLNDMMLTKDPAKRGRPLLLQGPPGTAKTTMCELLASALGCHFIKIDGSGLSQSGGVSGHEAVFKNAEPGLIARALCDAPLDKPLMVVVDELGDVSDKAVLELAPVLDQTRWSYTDKNLGEHCPFDLSWTSFAFTTNTRIVKKIENRCNLQVVPPLNDAQRREIIRRQWQAHQEDLGDLPGLAVSTVEWLLRKCKADHGARSLNDDLANLATTARSAADDGFWPADNTLVPANAMKLLTGAFHGVEPIDKAHGDGFAARITIGDLAKILTHKEDATTRFIGKDAAWRVMITEAGIQVGCISEGRRRGIMGVVLGAGDDLLDYDVMNLIPHEWGKREKTLQFSWEAFGLPEALNAEGAINEDFQAALEGGDDVFCQIVFSQNSGAKHSTRRETLRQGYDLKCEPVI